MGKSLRLNVPSPISPSKLNVPLPTMLSGLPSLNSKLKVNASDFKGKEIIARVVAKVPAKLFTVYDRKKFKIFFELA
ncbi:MULTISPECIES: hypothetical protein [unclassified Okeania]|uniref:hypothetical protein n=1 Tax=unclassified Okeania TaxID=2634635 RepID=UPI0013BE1D54|nr:MULTISPECIES: hypothetical protein [unclassified Okeania]NES77434.1 hypothetical protein [Okeania sp. SIO1H4]NET13535.1 hypothetical protein [Okeania sp. SIO1H6]NET20940.1 hypothetical protein [Okeania sp. SIO1H5]NET95902.1 hypothetical protein [Okeania sp. SIO1H2]